MKRHISYEFGVESGDRVFTVGGEMDVADGEYLADALAALLAEVHNKLMRALIACPDNLPLNPDLPSLLACELAYRDARGMESATEFQTIPPYGTIWLAIEDVGIKAIRQILRSPIESIQPEDH